jgi:hypothetical protein
VIGAVALCALNELGSEQVRAKPRSSSAAHGNSEGEIRREDVTTDVLVHFRVEVKRWNDSMCSWNRDRRSVEDATTHSACADLRDTEEDVENKCGSVVAGYIVMICVNHVQNCLVRGELREGIADVGVRGEAHNASEGQDDE